MTRIEVSREQKRIFEGGWTASRGFRELRCDVGDDQGARFDFGPLATAQ